MAKVENDGLTHATFKLHSPCRPKDRSTAKYDLKYSRRSHFAADDDAYQCMGIQEDAEGRKGVYLKKDVVKVANVALNKHIKAVAPYILPLRQLVSDLMIPKVALDIAALPSRSIVQSRKELQMKGAEA